MHRAWQVRSHIADYGAFHRAYVGNDGACGEVWADFSRYRFTGADRNARDHQIRALYRGSVGLHNLIRQSELGDPPARLRRARSRDDRSCAALGASCPRDGRTALLGE